MKKRQIPHTYAIIFYIILFCAALTWIIPGGQYKESINAAGEKTVVYEAVEHVPQTWQVFSAFYKGFVDKRYHRLHPDYRRGVLDRQRQ